MENVKYTNLDEAIKQMASEIAKAKVKFQRDSNSSENTQEDNQKKLQLMLIEIPQNEEKLRNSIEYLYSTIEQSNPEEKLPKDLKLSLVNYMAEQITSKNIINVEQLDFSVVSVKQMIKDSGYDIKYGEETIEKNEYEEFTTRQEISTAEEFELFQEEMIEKYGGNYFTESEFESIEKTTIEIFNRFGREKIEKMIEKANNGDFETAKKLLILQDAFFQVGLNSGVEEVPQERLREYLESMIVMMELVPSDETMMVCEEMAGKISADIYSVDERGKKKLDINKLREEFKKVDEGIGIDLEYTKKNYEDAAQSYIENPENQFEGVDEFEKLSIESGTAQMLAKMYEICAQEQDSTPNAQKVISLFADMCKKNRKGAINLAELIVNSDRDRTDINERRTMGVLFESIVRSGIEQRETVDEKLIQKMTSLDTEGAKVIVEKLISEYNIEHGIEIGNYIQILSKSIKEHSTEEIKAETEKNANPISSFASTQNFEDDELLR